MFTREVRKKCLLAIFSPCLFVSIVSACSGGTGEPNNPYRIADLNDLLALSSAPADYNKCFILTADINMAGQIFTMAPIAPDINAVGTFQGTPFSGTFDGSGHKITRLTINGPSNDYIALFGCVLDGKIRNLGVENISVNGHNYVGSLAGINYYGSIINCYSTGTVSGAFSTGGLVGFNFYGGNITNCYSTAAVSGSDETGGLVGEGYYVSSITNCYSAGAVSGSSSTGGLVGYNNARITASFWDVNTSGQSTSAGGTGKTTAQMKTRSTFTSAGWDFLGETVNGPNDIWRMCVDGVYYPHLTWEYLRRGDFNCPDGTDFQDLELFSGHWLLETPSYDLNNDGIVNFLDFALFAENWLKQ